MNKNDIDPNCEDAILIREVVRPSGNTPFSDWFNSIRDLDARAQIRRRLEVYKEGYRGQGRFPASAPISELKISEGQGYRVYFTCCGEDIVILLFGGTKGSQKRDLEKARNIWEEVVNGQSTVEIAVQRSTVGIYI